MQQNLEHYEKEPTYNREKYNNNWILKEIPPTNGESTM